MEKYALWTRSFILDCLICFMLNLSYYLTMVVMTDYTIRFMDASLSAAGFACGVIILGVLVARMGIGRSIERIGTKKCLYAGIVIFLVSSIVNLWVTNLELLYLIRLIQGIGFGAGSTATATIMAHLVPDERRGEGTAYFAMFVTLATAIGPFVGLFIYGNGDLSNNLLLSSVLLAVSGVMTFALTAPSIPVVAEEEDRRPERFSLLSFFEVTALPIAFITFFISIGFASLLSFMSPFTTSRGLVVGGQFFFVAYAVFTLVSRPFTGRLFDLKGDNVVLIPAFVLYAVGLCVLGLAQTDVMVLIAGALIGVGFGTYMSCAQAVTIKMAPADHMGLANSTFFIFMDLGVGLGPLLLGKLIPVLQFSGMYEFLAVVVLVCLVLYHFLHGRKARKLRMASHGHAVMSQ